MTRKEKIEKQYEIVQHYIDHNAQKLKSEYKVITGILAGNSPHAKRKTIGVIFQVADLKLHGKKLPKLLIDGEHRHPVYLQKADIAKPRSSPQYLDAGVSRVNDVEYGTFGIPINYNNELHILSCYHVYFNEEMKNGLKVANATTGISDRRLISPSFKDKGIQEDEYVGKIVEGEISDFLDIAIMKPSVTFQKKFSRLPGPLPYILLSRDQEKKIYLRFWGNGTKNICQSMLLNINTGQWIDYEGIGSCYIQGLIQIEKCAIGGDSGAAICDLSGNLIGIVVASDHYFTYVMSAYNIQDKTKYKL